MNPRTKPLFSSTKILVSVLFIATAVTFIQQGTFLSRIPSVGQLASVASGINGCYTESDVAMLQSTKSVTETQLQDVSFEISRISNQVDQTVSAIDTNYIELESLKSSLISEDTLIALRAEIDLVETKLVESQQTPADSGVCSAYGYYDKKSCESAGEYENGSCTGGPQYQDEVSCLSIGSYDQGSCSDGRYYDKYSCENAGTEQWGYGPGSTSEYCTGGGGGYSYTDYNSCTNARYYHGGGCNGPYYDKYSCENAGGFSSGWCSGGSIHSDQYSCETAGFSPGYCSGGSQYENEPACLSAGAYAGRCSDETYPDENSCVNALCQSSPAFCTDGTFETYEDCVTGGHTWYSAQSQACGNTWTPPSSGYNFTWYPGSPAYGYQWYPPMFTPAGHTWTEPTFYSYNYSWNQTWYAQWMQWFSSYGYTWTEPAWVSAGYQWTPGTFRNYGYTWIPTPPTTEQEGLTQTLALLSDEYMQKIEQRSALIPLIQTAEEASTTLSLLLVEQTREKADVKARHSELQQKVDELISELAYSVQSMCQTVETACSNALDDDNDGLVDCSDSDCSNDSSCQTGETTNSSTNINYIPIQAGIPAPFISDRSLSIAHLLKNNLSLLKQQNETVIVPAMKRIETKAAASAYDELPDLMEKAQNHIDTAEASVDRNTTDSYLLKTENELTTSDADVKAKMDVYVTATNNLLKDHTAYFKILEKFLVESIPTPDLYSSLNRSISDLKNSGEEYDAVLTRLTLAIDSKNALRQKVVSVTAFTPAPGSSFPYYTPIEKLSIGFNKPIEKYLGGTIVIMGADTPVFEAAILPINSGDYSLSASIPTLSPEKTYSVVTDIQLQFEGKAYSLKNTNAWTFSVERDPTNIKTSEDLEDEANKGLSEEEKCEKKKGFWSKLFGGKCKPKPDICCVCAYGNFNSKITFEANCNNLINANACTQSTKVYTPTDKAVDKVIENFPNSCPSDDYDDVRLFYEKHGDPTGEEQKFCQDLPMSIVESYERNNMPVPSNITVSHGQCSAFNDLSEAKSWANNLSSQLASEGYVNIKINISGNQEPKVNAFYNNALGGPQDMLAVEDKDPDGTVYCAANTKFEVCSSAVKVELPACPAVGSSCKFGGDDNPTIECKNMFGFKTTRQCIADSPPVSNDGVTLKGTWAK